MTPAEFKESGSKLTNLVERFLAPKTKNARSTVDVDMDTTRGNYIQLYSCPVAKNPAALEFTQADRAAAWRLFLQTVDLISRARGNQKPVDVMDTGFGSRTSSFLIEGTKEGPHSYIEVAFDPDEIRITVELGYITNPTPMHRELYATRFPRMQ